VTEDAKSSPPRETAATLASGQTLGSRWLVEAPLPGPSGGFLGRDAQAGTSVVLIPVSKEHAEKLGRAKGVEHPHLAHVFDVIDLGNDKHVAVAATASGQTLEERLTKLGKKPAVDAVRSALRVADALGALHEVGAVHGFVHAGSVVLEPPGEPPLLTFVPPGEGEPLHAPERQPGTAPSVADDAWATAGLLHWMLAGSPPKASGYTNVEELESAGIAEEALRVILLPTLTADPTARQTNLKPLRRALARWFVEHAGEEPIPPGRHSNAPPPLPPSMRPSMRPGAAASLGPPPRRRRIVAFTVGAVVFGLVAGGIASLMRPKKVTLVPRPVATAAPSASAVEVNDVAVMAATPTNLGSKLAACMAGYLPKNTFATTPDVEWLCKETDPRAGADHLRVAVVKAAPKGGSPSDAMKIFSRIGWYDMTAFAVVRAGCCPEAPPITLPDAKCGMDTALRDVGDAVISTRDLAEPLKKYTESIHCELNRGGAKMLRRSERPAGGEDTAFLELVKHLE